MTKNRLLFDKWSIFYLKNLNCFFYDKLCNIDVVV